MPFCWMVLLACSTPAVSAAPERLPACGIMSAYSLLRACDHHPTVADVVERFEAECPGGDAYSLSMRDVGRVLDTFGIATVAVKIQPADLRRRNRPAILYFGAGRWPRNPSNANGHFVLFVGRNGNEAIVLDWRSNHADPTLLIPIEEFIAAWDGEAIIERTGVDYFRVPVATALGLMVVGLWLLAPGIGSAVRRRTSVPTCLIALLLLTGGGCGKSAPTVGGVPCLVFDQHVAQLGRIRQRNTASHEFTFRVWDRGPVKIAKISTSCGCTSASDSLVGQTLLAGSQHSVAVQVRRDVIGQPLTQLIRISTEPASAEPLTVAVRYEFVPGPQPTIAELRLETAPKQLPVGEVVVIHRRAVMDAPVMLDRAASRSAEFEIGEAVRSTEVVTTNVHNHDELAVDTNRIALRGRLPAGDAPRRSMVQLVWSDGTTNELPILVRQRLPLTPQLSHVYAGVLKPGMPWRQVVPCRSASDAAVPVRSVQSSDERVVARMDDKGNIEITGTAPATPGRFRAEITIHFSSDAMPALRLPVSGIVRTDDSSAPSGDRGHSGRK